MTTIADLQSRMRRCHAAMGREGRLAFTIGQGADEPCFITHWVRSGPSSFEDCKAVGVGTVDECLDALDAYVGRYVRRPTDAEVGRMLGLGAGGDGECRNAGVPDHYRIAAE